MQGYFSSAEIARRMPSKSNKRGLRLERRPWIRRSAGTLFMYHESTHLHTHLRRALTEQSAKLKKAVEEAIADQGRRQFKANYRSTPGCTCKTASYRRDLKRNCRNGLPAQPEHRQAGLQSCKMIFAFLCKLFPFLA
jgi:hypothetical protein